MSWRSKIGIGFETATIVAVSIAVSAWSSTSVAQMSTESVTEIDRNLIVECKLPGAVRKLGASLTIPMPGKIVQLSKADCEIRGGEYVAFDAADPARALSIWLDVANRGDATAQNRVGQIYEIGIGRSPDYAQAAKWYAKAAESGSRAAAINLAALYDRGLGVEKDPQVAAKLYGKALGIPETKPETIAAAKTATASDQQSSTQTTTLIDVGPNAGAKPEIVLKEPKLARTRGDPVIGLPPEAKVKDVIGRVSTRAGLASLKVNNRDVSADRDGFFTTPVRIESQGTKVTISAIDKVGARDDASFTWRPGAVETVAFSAARLDLSRDQVGKFHALVIGNRHYKDKRWDELANAESDARSVAALLEKKYGFQKPKLLIDATYAQIMNALNDYVKTLGPQDNLLIYYAGHGRFALGKRGYWIPVDGDNETDTFWIPHIRVTDLLQKMDAKKVLVVVDSCYGGAMTDAENGAIPTVAPGLSDDQFIEATNRLSQLKSRTVLTSGGLAPVLEEGVKDHSVFARSFLDVLESNDMPLEGYRLFLALEANVFKLAQQKNFDQTPAYAAIQAGHEGGDFVFIPVRRTAAEVSDDTKLAARAN